MPMFTMADLVARTGVPAATIHHYLRSGLLPRPKKVAPNRFTYDERHVRALKLVRTLRDRRGLALPMIKRIMPELLQLETTEAFRPEMWDRALAPRLSRRRRLPSARLLDVALDAFSRRGYDGVNVDEICRAARIAKGSFYRHYRSKEELFFAAADSAASEVMDGFRRAVAASQLDAEAAGLVLGPILEPRLPLFLDLFAGAMQRRPGYPAGARTVFSRISIEIGLLLKDEPRRAPQDLGAAAIGAAVSLAFRHVAGLPGSPAEPLAEPPAVTKAAEASTVSG
jgi:AcrR family transcriptional regulator